VSLSASCISSSLCGDNGDIANVGLEDMSLQPTHKVLEVCEICYSRSQRRAFQERRVRLTNQQLELQEIYIVG
jgi:hypothetical protein